MLKILSNKEIIKVIKLYLPAQNPTSNSMLNPILGQAGVNSVEFNKKFIELSRNYKKDVVLKIRILLYIDKTFDIVLNMPTLSYILNEEMFVQIGKRKLQEEVFVFEQKINLSKIYKISFILRELGFDKSILKIVKLILSTLKSMHCIVINDIN